MCLATSADPTDPQPWTRHAPLGLRDGPKSAAHLARATEVVLRVGADVYNFAEVEGCAALAREVGAANTEPFKAVADYAPNGAGSYGAPPPRGPPPPAATEAPASAPGSMVGSMAAEQDAAYGNDGGGGKRARTQPRPAP